MTVESKSQVETPSDGRSSRKMGDTDVEGRLTVRDRRMEKTCYRQPSHQWVMVVVVMMMMSMTIMTIHTKDQ